MDSTPLELVYGVVALHSPISGRDISAKCTEAGFGNPMSTAAVLFNAKKSGLITKTPDDLWTTSTE